VCAAAVLVEDLTLPPGQRQEHAFSLDVPADAQASARAERNEQHWLVRAVLDRKLKSDHTAELEVVVLT
jgi:hypothetical protein